tara:strand:+ start:136 stop:804 length:669 start_codon:yes stop_codon:yes gene_type:complete
MLYQILSDDDLNLIQTEVFSNLKFVDGKNTQQLSKFYNIKDNKETVLPEKLQKHVQKIFLEGNLIKSIYAPTKVVARIYNRYSKDDFYDYHIDPFQSSTEKMIYNYGFTICISDEYEGGEFIVKTNIGEAGYKLTAGQGLIFPVIYPHKVAPVTEGLRENIIGWFSSNITYEQSYILQNLFEATQIELQLIKEENDDIFKELLQKTALVQSYLTTKWGFKEW